jgi:prolipoprotein diacylglyceryltransferase
MLPVIAFPAIDPVALQVGPFALRWYALAYIAGIVGGWLLARRLAALAPVAASREQIDDAVTWVTLGIILGGRLGYVLFYRPGYYLSAPWEALYVWQGGMAFHGGALGVIVAILLFCRKYRLDPSSSRTGWWRWCRSGSSSGGSPTSSTGALGPRQRRALGDGLPDRRAGAAAPEPALPGPSWRAPASSSC